MKSKEIRDLIDFISSTDLNKVSIETEEIKLSVVRNSKGETQIVSTPIQPPNEQVATPVPVATTPANKPAETEDSSNYLEVKSPMIGTFYRSANPESPAFVSVGDTIESGQTVCVVEAMKLFNEIESEISGTIAKVMVENASPVEYDQVLFLVNPS